MRGQQAERNKAQAFTHVMNAHVVRLDALGQRLTQMAGLDDGEFDFAATPSLGGPEELVPRADLDQVAQRLNSRPRKTLGYVTPADTLATTVASTG